MTIERNLAGRGTNGLPAAIRAGGLIFVDACEGGQGDVTAQCEQAYAQMADRLQQCGVGVETVARLDHYTESQDWLAERQAIRARYFGRPAPVASTGVAVRHTPPNRLSVAGVAVQDATKKKLRIAGDLFGMSAIATAVDVGDLVFISGILNDGGHAPIDGHAHEFSRQASGCFRTILSILEQLQLSPTDVVRQDIYIDETWSYADLVGLSEPAEFLTANTVRSGAKLPFGGGDLIEVTTIAAKRRIDVLNGPADPNIGPIVRSGGFCFTDACGDSVGAAVANLIQRIDAAGVSSDRVVRLDVRCADPGECRQARSAVSSALSGVEPVVITYNGQPLRGDVVGISAIIASG